MPIYEYRCETCGADDERLQALGADAPVDGCQACGGPLKRRFSRVAVKYQGWGFSSTDALVADNRGKDFRALRDRAERISDAGGG
ncbi:MAG TPA: FmdB family zinc ribbon protein [Egibacteraceae bacterium]|nr:FmdB family zinc ribbon protein [Egibacteraceae bacterium]